MISGISRQAILVMTFCSVTVVFSSAAGAVVIVIKSSLGDYYFGSAGVTQYAAIDPERGAGPGDAQPSRSPRARHVRPERAIAATGRSGAAAPGRWSGRSHGRG